MHGHVRGWHGAAFEQFGQRGIGMLEHVLFEPAQRLAFKGRVASGVGRPRLDGPGVTIALQDVLDRAARHAKPLGDLAHR